MGEKDLEQQNEGLDNSEPVEQINSDSTKEVNATDATPEQTADAEQQPSVGGGKDSIEDKTPAEQIASEATDTTVEEPEDLRKPEEKIYSILVERDEVTWKDLMFDIINAEGMDPWNVSISELSHMYIQTIKDMQKLNMKVTGKVVLAATLLLRYKSKRLVGEDLDEFDRMLAAQEMSADEFYEDLARRRDPLEIPEIERMKLIPRMPQPRQRKVSIYDLVGALEKALEVKKRRILRTMPNMNLNVPTKKKNIEVIMKEVYKKVLLFFNEGFKRLTFGELTRNTDKEEKLYTFQSLLYLYYKRQIDISQAEHFGEIDVKILSGKGKATPEEA